MSDKTEQPTPKRLRESREKGDVCKSQDIPSALTVLALSVYIVATGRQLLEALLTMMEIPMRLMSEPYVEAAPRSAEATFSAALSVVAPIVGIVMAVALIANLGQVGVLFAFKAAMPKLENVSPVKWFQRSSPAQEPCGVPQEHHQGRGSQRHGLDRHGTTFPRCSPSRRAPSGPCGRVLGI